MYVVNTLPNIFSCTLLISNFSTGCFENLFLFSTNNSMISHEIWKKHALVGFSKITNSTRPLDSCILRSLKNSLVHVFSQIALEIMQLPILNRNKFSKQPGDKSDIV